MRCFSAKSGDNVPHLGAFSCPAAFGCILCDAVWRRPRYKSNTLLSADDIRRLIIPEYKKIISLVHSKGRPFLLHSCGCIFGVMDHLIDAGIDAKHSNEDEIAPFPVWVERYGDRIGNWRYRYRRGVQAVIRGNERIYPRGAFKMRRPRGWRSARQLDSKLCRSRGSLT